MTDWVSLRDYLTEYVDRQIADEPDREARSIMAFHRERIVDQMELAVLHQWIHAEEPSSENARRMLPRTNGRVIRMNGHAGGK